VVRQIEYGSFDNGLTALLGQTRANQIRTIYIYIYISIIAADYSNKIQLFDVQTQTKLGSPLTVDLGVESVAFSPDGSIIATANDYEIQLFDAQTKKNSGRP
jgi:WD40 repeat protein